MKFFKRENYLRKIRGFYHDVEIIKVITGVRRCGKSCLMETIADELRAQGVSEARIVYLNLDKRPYRRVKTADALEALIEEKTTSPEVTYLFIDEIQNVEGFEEVVNGFREEGRHSIFMTGSNSYLLSGDLVTKLTGRYLEFEMFPLTFDEYLGMKTFYGKPVSADVVSEFDQFLRNGGLPKSVQYDTDADRRAYVEGVVSEIFEKDIRRRVKVRHVSAFKKVQTYLANNFGARTSLTNILADLEKDGTHVKRETLHRYVEILKDAKILYECNRFDLRSRKSICGEQKYYLADLGFYFANNTDVRINYGPVLENVLYVYARAHGYSVSVGRIGSLECDFIVRKGEDYAYVQVAMSIADHETENREYRPFEHIRDAYPRYLFTLDSLLQKRNGVRHENLIQFMSEGRML